jgi:kynurenine formamidase
MRIIDLSTPLFTNMTIFPGDPAVKIEVIHTHDNETWELRHLSMGSHTGTHVDAFSHMHEGAENLDEIPLENFCGEAQLVSINQMWPQKIGLFFMEEVGVEEVNRIIASNPKFIGGNITEELERALLVNLESLPKESNFMFYGFPLKIQSGDGSPVRAIAMVED